MKKKKKRKGKIGEKEFRKYLLKPLKGLEFSVNIVDNNVKVTTTAKNSVSSHIHEKHKST